jgi:hypothetical protein
MILIRSPVERAGDQSKIRIFEVAVKRFLVDPLGDLRGPDDLLRQDPVDHRLPLLAVDLGVGREDGQLFGGQLLQGFRSRSSRRRSACGVRTIRVPCPSVDELLALVGGDIRMGRSIIVFAKSFRTIS